MTQQFDLFGSRRPQQRWIAAHERRLAGKATFDALPEHERAAIWTRIDRLLFIEATWRVARTMPENPHSYTRRRDWKHDDDFVFVVQFIRSGVCDREKYPPGPDGRWYDILNRVYNGIAYKVWPMGWPINYSDGRPCTILLNRKPVQPSDR
jgi:hypothetical protein